MRRRQRRRVESGFPPVESPLSAHRDFRQRRGARGRSGSDRETPPTSSGPAVAATTDRSQARPCRSLRATAEAVVRNRGQTRSPQAPPPAPHRQIARSATPSGRSAGTAAAFFGPHQETEKNHGWRWPLQSASTYEKAPLLEDDEVDNRL